MASAHGWLGPCPLLRPDPLDKSEMIAPTGFVWHSRPRLSRVGLCGCGRPRPGLCPCGRGRPRPRARGFRMRKNVQAVVILSAAKDLAFGFDCHPEEGFSPTRDLSRSATDRTVGRSSEVATLESNSLATHSQNRFTI